jgi:hypothetical protein
VTTREKAHRLLDELPESEVEPVLEFIVSRREGDGAAVGEAIADGYRRFPQTPEEDAWAAANAREAVREEPW